MGLGITFKGTACEIAPVLRWDMTVGEGRQPNLRMRFPVMEFVGSCLSIYYSFTDIYNYLFENGEHISLQKTICSITIETSHIYPV